MAAVYNVLGRKGSTTTLEIRAISVFQFLLQIVLATVYWIQKIRWIFVELSWSSKGALAEIPQAHTKNPVISL